MKTLTFLALGLASATAVQGMTVARVDAASFDAGPNFGPYVDNSSVSTSTVGTDTFIDLNATVDGLFVNQLPAALSLDVDDLTFSINLRIPAGIDTSTVADTLDIRVFGNAGAGSAQFRVDTSGLVAGGAFTTLTATGANFSFGDGTNGPAASSGGTLNFSQVGVANFSGSGAIYDIESITIDAVPEPSSALLVGLAGLFMARRRR